MPSRTLPACSSTIRRASSKLTTPAVETEEDMQKSYPGPSFHLRSFSTAFDRSAGDSPAVPRAPRSRLPMSSNQTVEDVASARELNDNAGRSDWAEITRHHRGKRARHTGSREVRISKRHAHPRKLPRRSRETRPHLDGGAHAQMGELRPPDGRRLCLPNRDRSLLCPSRPRPAHVARCYCVPRRQLVWRQPRWHTGSRPPATAPALRLLRRPHDRFHRCHGDDGRLGALRLHAS